MNNLNEEMQGTLSYISEAKKQVYNQLIQASQNLNKEQLLELFSKTFEYIAIQDNELLMEIEKTNNLSLATSYAKSTEQCIKNIDNTADSILSRINQIETPVNENSLPGNILM